MLNISHYVLQALKREIGNKGVVKIIDENDDLYRLLPNGDIYVHWYQEGPFRYTSNGAYIGNLLNDCIRQPPQVIDNQ